MKEKLKIKAIIIFIPIVLIGSTYLVNSYLKKDIISLNNKCVVVSDKVLENQNVDDKPIKIVQKWESKNIKGLTQILGVISDDEVLVGIGLSKDEFSKKYKGKNLSQKSEEGEFVYEKEYWNANDDINGKVYKLNLKTLEKTSLKNKEENIKTKYLGAGLSPDYNKLDYEKNDSSYLYRLKDITEIKYNKGMLSNWSEDGRYLIGYRNIMDNNLDYSQIKKFENKLYLYDTKNKGTKEVFVDPNVVTINKYPSFYSEDGKDIYFIGEQIKKGEEKFRRQGIFKINVESKKIKEIIVLPYRDSSDGNGVESCIPSNNYKFIDDGKKIILHAIINNQSGLYIYDIQNKKFFKTLPNIKTKEGDYCPNFSLSPDKTKIAYINKTEENADINTKWTLYVARINGNSLTNRIILKRNIEIGGDIDNIVNWSKDSKTMVYFTGSYKDVGGFTLSDKNIINMVRFK